VSLRRAISTAYYALFHALVAEAVLILAPSDPVALRPWVGRAFVHENMKRVCKGVGASSPASVTAQLMSRPFDQRLTFIAKTFVDMQEERHKADYDTTATLSKADVVLKLQDVEQAFTNLRAIRGNSNTNVFLAALLFQDIWTKR
jgi:uncharacterized protein (UPF0332 family)